VILPRRVSAENHILPGRGSVRPGIQRTPPTKEIAFAARSGSMARGWQVGRVLQQIAVESDRPGFPETPTMAINPLRFSPLKLSRFAGASLIMVIAGTRLAAAAEWRFCIAPSIQEHKIYVTAPYLTGTAMEALENGFHQALDRSGRRHDNVQCPTGASEQSVRVMRQHADEFNRQMGNEVIVVDWKPAAAGTLGR